MIEFPTQTLQGLRQVIVATLQNPPLQYYDQTGAIATLDPNSIYAKSIWQVGDAPSPIIAFSVGLTAGFNRMPLERRGRIYFWVVSSSGPDEVSAIYDAVYARFNLSDQEAPPSATDISRAAAGNALGISVRECVEMMALPVEFEAQTQRWYLSATYRVAAI